MEREKFPTSLKGKHILLATESLGPVNGVSRTTTSLIEYLRRNGVKVAVVAPNFEHQDLQQSNISHAEIRLSGQPLPYNPDLTIVHPFRYNGVCARTFKPDLVYLASPASVGFQMLLQIAQLRLPPAVVCNFQTDLAAYGQILLPAKMAQYAEWLLGVVQGFLFGRRSVHTVFYPSSAIKEYLVRIGVATEKLARLGRGVDTSLFNPVNREGLHRSQIAHDGEIILVSVCRLAPEKDFRFLAKVAEQMVERSVRFKLLIVGGNRNPHIENEVRGYFANVKQHVIFTGFLRGEALARAYAVGDIFLHCSITETFGLVILEAMASGLPIVARDQGGPSDIVQHGHSGYLIQPGNIDEFVKKTVSLIQDQEFRSRMASAALKQAQDTTWEKINLRVAWHLVKVMRETAISNTREDQKVVADRLPSQIRTLVEAPTELVRTYAAVAVVCIFWVIAVLPLIAHGHLLGLRRLESEGCLHGLVDFGGSD